LSTPAHRSNRGRLQKGNPKGLSKRQQGHNQGVYKKESRDAVMGTGFAGALRCPKSGTGPNRCFRQKKGTPQTLFQRARIVLGGTGGEKEKIYRLKLGKADG